MALLTKASVLLDDTGEAWEGIVDELLANSDHIIALRGAGSFNGISITDANWMVEQHCIPRIATYVRGGAVSIIFDGDNDDPLYPDIGHIAGRLRDYFVEMHLAEVISQASCDMSDVRIQGIVVVAVEDDRDCSSANICCDAGNAVLFHHPVRIRYGYAIERSCAAQCDDVVGIREQFVHDSFPSLTRVVEQDRSFGQQCHRSLRSSRPENSKNILRIETQSVKC